MPLLAFSQGVEACLSLALFGFGCSVVLLVLPEALSIYSDRIGAFCLTCFAALILRSITRAKLQPWATQLPVGGATVDLTKQIVAKIYGRIATRAGGWNEKGFWTSLRDVVCDATLVERERP